MLQKSSWIRGRLRKHKTQVTISRNGLFIKNKPFKVHIPIDIEEFPQTFFLHCKLCYHYFEIKLLLTSASTEIIPLLDSSCSERILSNLVLSHSISIALYETVLLLLREKKRKLAEKDPQMCYNHYITRWLHLFNMLFLTFFCLLFLSHEICACGASKKKTKQCFSKFHVFP